MSIKPITITRNEYIQMLCDVTNSVELPAFVKADVVEKLLSELRKLANSEFEHDMCEYEKQRELQKNNSEVVDTINTFEKEIQIPVDDNFKQIGPPIVLDVPKNISENSRIDTPKTDNPE